MPRPKKFNSQGAFSDKSCKINFVNVNFIDYGLHIAFTFLMYSPRILNNIYVCLSFRIVQNAYMSSFSTRSVRNIVESEKQ